MPFPRTTRLLTVTLLGAGAGPLLPALPREAALQAQESASARRATVDTSYTLTRGGSVDLGLVSGEIIVTGSTRPELRVVADIDRGTLETLFSPSRASVQARKWRGELGRARYEVTVPIGTRVTASAVSGDVMVRATAGEVVISTVSGDVALADAADRYEVSTVSGDVRVTKVRGRGRLNSVSGNLEVRDVAGELVTRSVSGDVDVLDARCEVLRVATTSGEVVYEGSFAPSGTYELSTHSGDVRLAVPGDAGARIELQTYSGDLRSAFPITLQPGGANSARRTRRMEFTVGSGDARVLLETFSGDITIERALGGRRE